MLRELKFWEIQPLPNLLILLWNSCYKIPLVVHSVLASKIFLGIGRRIQWSYLCWKQTNWPVTNGRKNSRFRYITTPFSCTLLPGTPCFLVDITMRASTYIKSLTEDRPDNSSNLAPTGSVQSLSKFPKRPMCTYTRIGAPGTHRPPYTDCSLACRYLPHTASSHPTVHEVVENHNLLSRRRSLWSL